MNPLQALQPPLTQLPSGLCSAADYEALAPQFMAPGPLAHVAGGTGADTTVVANRAAFGRWAVMPRLLRDVRAGHTRLSLAGRPMRHPLMLAAAAHQRLAHPHGEVATALAAEATDTTMVLSTQSSIDLETVAAAARGPKWFQLYFQPARAATLDLVRRAERAGYQALVVTLDAPVQAPSHRAVRAGFQWPADLVAANLLHHAPVAAPARGPDDSPVFQGPMAQAPTWDDLAWLIATSTLPVWIKGVLHPDDARALASSGAAGLVVSNHGGRSLDGAPASLDMLPAVRAAVGSGVPLLFDSGVRSGTDVFKALALGADAVMVGRLPMYALAVAGALGVAHLLRLLREELELCMALAGCATLADIGPACLHPAAPAAGADPAVASGATAFPAALTRFNPSGTTSC